MSAFGDAFKAAREAGKKTFTFNGKSYHTRTKEDEGKAKAAPKAADKAKTPPMDDATKARVERNQLEQRAMRGEDMSDYVKKMPDNRPPAKGATFSDKGAPERKPVEGYMKAPDKGPFSIDDKGTLKRKPVDIIKADSKDDTSLSVSERIKRAKDRARTSDTGTDTRSVSERIKSAVKFAGDAVSPTAGMARRAREAAEKEMGKGMKRGGTVRGDGIAKRGKTKGRMC